MDPPQPVHTGSNPHGRRADGTPALGIILVDTDPTRRNARRATLAGGGAARVVTADDHEEVADALHLFDPDVVIVTTAGSVHAGRLLRAVRAQLELHREAVPIVAWQTRPLLHATRADLLAAGADAVVGDTAPVEELVATVHALRRTMAGAARRTVGELSSATTVIDALQVSVALVERDGHVRDANAAMHMLWRETTGQRSSPVGGELAQLLVPADRATLAQAVAALCAAPAGSVTELECCIGASPLRSIPVHMRLVRIGEGETNAPVVAQLNDLREKRRVEDLLRAGRWRALDRQQILDLSSRLHGLLAAVAETLGAGSGSRGAGDVSLSSTQAAMVRGTLSQSGQLLAGLQAIANEQEHPAALLDVRTLVDGHLDLFRQMLPGHIALTWDAGAPDLLVRGSEPQLQQVLTALVMNAWDAQRSGGAIHVNVRHTDEAVVIGVEDHGPGVPEEKHDWIFQPMTSTRSADGASGLGLVTARRAVEMHGGQLRLDRFRDVGARFEIILPRYRSRAQSAKPKAPLVVPIRAVAGL